eukprot:TRINITY_DN15761_c0_g1_i1.p1 TRINITY_DN15761_c0_g1~~TRINITY_DN15761_c0_g1_i1.p1  ORF type:complete len:640 (+),score=116.97 TRINITY_DN15761_c0_g1_i1:277-2196(+)
MSKNKTKKRKNAASENVVQQRDQQRKQNQKRREQDQARDYDHDDGGDDGDVVVVVDGISEEEELDGPRANRPEGGEMSNTTLLRRVLAYCLPFWTSIVGVIIIIIANAALDQYLPMLYREMIRKALPSGELEQVYTVGAKMVGLTLTTTGMAVLRDQLSLRLGEGVSSQLRKELFAHLQKLPFHFFTQTKPGEFVSLFNNELMRSKDAIGRVIPTVLYKVFTIVFTLVSMFRLNTTLATMALLILPLYQFPTSMVSSVIRNRRREVIARKADMNDTVGEVLSADGALLFRTLGTEGRASDTFRVHSTAVHDAEMSLVSLQSWFSRGIFCVVSLVSVVVYTAGGTLFLSTDDLDVATIVTFGQYLGKLYNPLSELSDVHIRMMQSAASFERLFSYLDIPILTEDAPKSASMKASSFEGRVDFEGLGFCFKGNDTGAVANWVFRGLDLTLTPGETIALVGANGAGKTTIGHLIAGLYFPSTGVVKLDGIDIRSIPRDVITQVVGVLPQETFLLHDTVANNLRLAHPDATDEELMTACRKANLASVIKSLSHGLQTVVGHRAYHLSGGERQKLAIARIFLRDPKVLVLDEAMSALDDDSSASVSAAICRMMEGRTCVFITHRLPPIKFDRVLRLQHGEIISE